MRKLSGTNLQFEFCTDQVFPPKRVLKIKQTKNGLLFLFQGLVGEWLAHYEPNPLPPDAAIIDNWKSLYVEADGKGSVLVLDDEDEDDSYFKLSAGWFVLKRNHTSFDD